MTRAPDVGFDSSTASNSIYSMILKLANKLSIGVVMEIHGEEPAEVAADVICLNCDRPAISKFNGTAGHMHDRHPCPWCHVNILEVNKVDGYNFSSYFWSLVY